MTKKIALFALAIASAAQADSSCDVTSRLYGGFGLGFSNAHAPLLKHKGLAHGLENEYNNMTQAQRNLIDLSKADITTSYKKMRALATRLALGGHFLVPNTCLVLGAEMSLGLGGSKGQIKQNLDKTNIARAVAPESNASGSYVCKIRDRWNVAFTGIVGAKVGRILPYAKVGVAIHAFKTTEELSINGKTISATITKKKKPLFVMGLGAEYNVTKNIIVGAEWTHHRGTLGLLSKEAKKDATKQDKKMNKIRINEFMVTCKYAFPVSH
jgi:opacity protein-like surface antigen